MKLYILGIIVGITLIIGFVASKSHAADKPLRLEQLENTAFEIALRAPDQKPGKGLESEEFCQVVESIEREVGLDEMIEFTHKHFADGDADYCF